MKYDVELQTITPLHIGNEKKYDAPEYFIEEGCINIVDIKSILEVIEKRSTDEIIKVVDELSRKIMVRKNDLGQKPNAKEFFADYKITDISNFVIKKLQTDIKPHKRVEIQQFINQNGKYYIPGSSIKGAIRTAYLFNYLDNNENIGKLVEVLGDKNVKLKDKYKKLNEKVFGEEVEKDVFKYIHVEDSHFINDEYIRVIETRRHNNKNPGHGGFPICLEVIKENTPINFRIRIQEGFRGKIEDIKNSIRNLTRVICDYEINNIKNPPFQKFYKGILKDMENPDEIYINIGFGGGYLTKSIYLLLWKYKNKKKEINIDLIKELLPTRKNRKTGTSQQVNAFEDFPRTRTLYNDKPIGWVKLKFKNE